MIKTPKHFTLNAEAFQDESENQFQAELRFVFYPSLDIDGKAIVQRLYHPIKLYFFAQQHLGIVIHDELFQRICLKDVLTDSIERPTDILYIVDMRHGVNIGPYHLVCTGKLRLGFGREDNLVGRLFNGMFEDTGFGTASQLGIAHHPTGIHIDDEPRSGGRDEGISGFVGQKEIT